MELTRAALRRIGNRKRPVGLVLAGSTKAGIARMERRFVAKSGGRFLALLSGAKGMGKTATVSALRKKSGRPAYRLDCSKLFSKYIGETEKNMKRVFDAALNKGAILFFDEADALFGKRTNVKDAHDRYANQEVSYLLQRVRSYDGPVVFLSRDAALLKKSFLRHLDCVIEFKPGRVRQTRNDRIRP